MRVARQCVARDKAEAVRRSKATVRNIFRSSFYAAHSPIDHNCVQAGRVEALQAKPLELETPRTMKARQAAGPMMTGNAQADADIVAFYKAREQLLASQSTN